MLYQGVIENIETGRVEKQCKWRRLEKRDALWVTEER